MLSGHREGAGGEEREERKGGGKGGKKQHIIGPSCLVNLKSHGSAASVE